MMEPRTLAFVEQSCNGQLVAGERSASVRHICTDSRLAKPGLRFAATGLTGTTTSTTRLAKGLRRPWSTAPALPRRRAPGR